MRREGKGGAATEARLIEATNDLLELGAIGVMGAWQVPSGEAGSFACGVADRKSRRPMSQDLLFFAGSQTKMLTAAAVLSLHKDGRYGLEDRIVDHLPFASDLGFDDAVTIRQLLQHTSGIGNYTDFLLGLPPNYPPWPFPALSDRDLMTLGSLKGQRFAPGTKWEYNNTAYIMLGELARAVSGRPVTTLIRERILDPLGMGDTSFGRDGWTPERLCSGYFRPDSRPDLVVNVAQDARDFSLASSAGDVLTSLTDLMTWLSALHRADNPTGLTLEDFLTDIAEVWPDNPDWLLARRYALGIEEVRLGGRSMWGHMGAIIGYRSGTFLDAVTGLVVSLAFTFEFEPAQAQQPAFHAKRQELLSLMAAWAVP